MSWATGTAALNHSLTWYERLLDVLEGHDEHALALPLLVDELAAGSALAGGRHA